MSEKSSGSHQVSVFGNQAIDQAVCGIGAGCVSVLMMHPLDLLKVKFQVSTLLQSNQSNSIVNLNQTRILLGLKEILKQDGFKGLYRGLSPNLIGNASSWGFYFLWYSIFKKKMATNSDGTNIKLSASQHLLASASSGFITAILTNPFWVVKTRMFTSRSSSVGAYSNVWDGLSRISKEEGIRGLWKGTILALIGVSNGAIQFMTYEELKRWRQESIQNSSRANLPLNIKPNEIPLTFFDNQTNFEYIVMSGASKLLAIAITYPYQVIRSRLQNQLFVQSPVTQSLAVSSSSNIPHYHSIGHCVTHTYQTEGLKAFYKGLAVNAIRILPGTCVTFVVYENLSRWLKQVAEFRNERR
ncbi:hypothetical protein O181_043943 [Austropuccinia psidii MF-1]|uniref:Uncharacterized protein n=1 Tax=Austropuccinia psidii MF-1 TaxID=1389203 RepID=A0A9Q3DMF4_9BASI|nr:hypothetical protein [Austropuccinia psidii MF-1]